MTIFISINRSLKKGKYVLRLIENNEFICKKEGTKEEIIKISQNKVKNSVYTIHPNNTLLNKAINEDMEEKDYSMEILEIIFHIEMIGLTNQQAKELKFCFINLHDAIKYKNKIKFLQARQHLMDAKIKNFEQKYLIKELCDILKQKNSHKFYDSASNIVWKLFANLGHDWENYVVHFLRLAKEIKTPYYNKYVKTYGKILDDDHWLKTGKSVNTTIETR